MALEKHATPKGWRSKQAKEIVAAVRRAGGQVERTASGQLKVIGPAGAAIVASAPNAGGTGGRAIHNTLATIRSKTGLQVWTAPPRRGLLGASPSGPGTAALRGPDGQACDLRREVAKGHLPGCSLAVTIRY